MTSWMLFRAAINEPLPVFVSSLNRTFTYRAAQTFGGFLWGFMLVAMLAAGCTAQETLPFKMNVTQIEVFSADEQETNALRTITDPDQISHILSELNRLPRTSFSDPEPPANLYKIVMRNENDHVVFYYADRGQEGKIYTEKSAEKGLVWRTTETFAELILEDKRKPF